MVIEELDPKQPEDVAKAAGQKRKADLAAMEPKSAKRAATQVRAFGGGVVQWVSAHASYSIVGCKMVNGSAVIS